MTDTRSTTDQQGSTTTSSGPDGTTRHKAIEAYDGARESVSSAGRRATDAIDEAPLIALAGGLAAGALIAALLPRTQAEQRMLGPVGEKLGTRAKAAAEAARQAGTDRLKELGLTPDAATEKLKSVFDGASEAARASAQAAVGAAKGDSGSGQGRQ
jgi:hypothetical protein